MNGRRWIALVGAGLAAAAVGSLPAIAAGQGSPTLPITTTTTTTTPIPPGPADARMSLRLAGADGGTVAVGHSVRAIGRLRPFVGGQKVEVRLLRGHHTVKKKTPYVRQMGNRNVGRFKLRSGELVKPGHYRVKAVHAANDKQKGASARSRRFHIVYPDLDPGDRNSAVRIFNRLLDRQGYYTTHSRHYGSATGLAVLAFRKVNRMARTSNASPAIFKELARGGGSFHLKHPDAGRHVEVDISRQVMALANHGKAEYTFHVSTGAPATPTIRGHYHFYLRQPGYNSHRMYYSVYFHGNYATHGYNPVPTYPASHGCVRNPIPDSRFIYGWIRLGESIYVYD